MCDPVSGMMAAAFVIKAGGAIAGAAAQSKASKENKEAALRAMHSVWTDIALQQGQVIEGAAVSIFESEKGAKVEIALQQASAGEAGVTGISAKELEQAVERDQSEFEIQTERNRDDTLAQLQREKLTGRQIAQNRIRSVPPANPFATALRIGASATGAAGAIIDRRQLLAEEERV